MNLEKLKSLVNPKIEVGIEGDSVWAILRGWKFADRRIFTQERYWSEEKLARVINKVFRGST